MPGTPLHTVVGSIFDGPFRLLAENKQQQVLQAINESVSTPVDPAFFYLLIVVVLTVCLSAAIIRHLRHRKGTAKRKVVRNSARLLRHVARDLELSPTDLRKLRHHADLAGIENPLTLLLCPSLMPVPPQETEKPGTADVPGFWLSRLIRRYLRAWSKKPT